MAELQDNQQQTLHHIMYMSNVVGMMSEDDLKQILVKSRTNNTQRHITGMLVLSGDNWMQILEGEQATITAMFRRIQADPRHVNVYKLADGAVRQRSFPDWSMGFTTASPEKFERLVGYFNPAATEFAHADLTQADEEVLSLLKEFSLEREELL